MTYPPNIVTYYNRLRGEKLLLLVMALFVYSDLSGLIYVAGGVRASPGKIGGLWD